MIWCVFFRSHLCARLPLAISIKDAVFFLSIFLHRVVITDIYCKTFFITTLFYTIIYFRVMERQWRFSTLVLYEDWRDDCLMPKPFKVFTYHMHLRLEFGSLPGKALSITDYVSYNVWKESNSIDIWYYRGISNVESDIDQRGVGGGRVIYWVQIIQIITVFCNSFNILHNHIHMTIPIQRKLLTVSASVTVSTSSIKGGGWY